MSYKEFDPLKETRSTREKILADFSGDTKAYHKYIVEQRKNNEAEGWRYATAEEITALKHHPQQEQAL